MLDKPQGQDDSPPSAFENLDELAVPPPVQVQADDTQARRRPSTLEQITVEKTHSQGVYHRAEREYNLPAQYENLDEPKAPPPVESPKFERPQGYLEDHRSSTAHSSRVQSRRSCRDGTPLPEQPSSSSPSDLSPDKQPPSTSHARVSRLATELYTVSHLIFFSILGTLARLGLQALTFYPGAPVQTSVLWANVAGSLTIGFLVQDRKLFSSQPSSSTAFRLPPLTQQHPEDEEQKGKRVSPPSPNKKAIPLYIGLATGFCGSLTSFSSFIRDAFLALANALPVPISHTSTSPVDPVSNVHRNGGYSFMALLAVITTTVSLSISALVVGAQLALAAEKRTPSIPFLFARTLVDRWMVLLAWGSWLGAIFMAIWPPDRPGGPSYYGGQEQWRGRALFAIVFAPLGCLARFYISLLLNSKIASFPLGTFTINIAGTLLEGVFWDLQRSPSTVGGGLVGCQVLQGMMDGFCGAATTVSTWVAELRGLRRGHAWVYGATSVVVALAGMVGVMGGVLWGRGWERPVCL
ncbi:MAG: hypothetical protein LQ338_003042 [Usnochroma carphineum]|nr:MAG: hypothetical protein LQ338_003042 [Usnochroma carphineum]